LNVAQLLLRAARSVPDRPAIAIGRQHHASFAAVAARSAALAGAFRTRYGLVPGDRVALAMTNCADTIPAMFACWMAGLCAVPINARLHPREFAYILDHAGAALCLCTPDLEAGLAPLANELPGLRHLLVTGTQEFRRLDQAEPCAVAPCAPDDPAWLFYTSGTTGRPKGAVLTHRNLLFMSLAYYAEIDALDADGALLHAAPLSHGSGLYVLPHIARGAVQVIPESGHFDPAEMVELIGHYTNSSFFAAPTMVTRLVNSAAAGRLDPGRLRTIVYGGGPMYVADLERALALCGPRLAQIYGQGESPMTITCLPKAMHAERTHPQFAARLASVGTAFTGVEIRIAGPDDNELPPGEIGEILTRSDCVMAGYWRDQPATADALRGGWLHTGDMGSVDAAGFLTLKDRSKDLIISGGSNIYPREIEEVLLRHPGVIEAAVIGCPHPEWGEELVAIIVARPDARPDTAALDALCLENIARFKRPRRYRFVDALPKNNYGKILKTALRAQLAENEDG
jgi:long-chain acyl-CoA synthetase